MLDRLGPRPAGSSAKGGGGIAPAIAQISICCLGEVSEKLQQLRYRFLTHTMLSSRGEALVDERLNALVVNDLPARVAAIRELIARLDAQLTQVAIEAHVVTASDNLNHQLGVQWRAQFSSAEDQGSPDTETEDISSLIATTAWL